MATDPILSAQPAPGPLVPLAGWAERQLAAFFALTGKPVPPELGRAGLLVERAAANGFTVPGLISAGGACRLIPARENGWVALNLAREDDRDLLPALFSDHIDPRDDAAIAACLAQCDADAIVARGRDMGLALASIDEQAVSPATTVATPGIERRDQHGRAPLVIDLSALWAGPLCGHLFWQVGAQVVKVESQTRPDAMRSGDPGLFALLNQGKASVAMNLRDTADRDALLAMIRRADIVIEAARPRALLQLGVDAESLVREVPGLVWLTITGHGASGDAAQWVGFGDDCSVAGGLSAALRNATGAVGFGGDAAADPLTGVAAANVGWERWTSGIGGRIILSMSGVTRAALDEERTRDPAGLDRSLKTWNAAAGCPIAHGPARAPTAPVAEFGSTAHWLASC